MAWKAFKSLICPISEDFPLAADDDLDRDSTNSPTYDITGAQRLIITRVPSSGGDAAAGVDVLQYSFDGGYEWQVATDLRLLDSADDSTALAGGAFGSAGVETAAVYKAGPFQGPTQIRVRTTTDWTTGAPSLKASVVGIGRDAVTAES